MGEINKEKKEKKQARKSKSNWGGGGGNYQRITLDPVLMHWLRVFTVVKHHYHTSSRAQQYPACSQ